YMILDFTNVGSRYIDFTRTITIGPNVEQLTLKGVPGITYILLDIIVANGRTKPLKLILWNMNYMAKSHGVNMYNETLNIEYYGNNSITAGYDKNGNADGYDAIRNVDRTVTINNGNRSSYIKDCVISIMYVELLPLLIVTVRPTLRIASYPSALPFLSYPAVM